jgi:hypothetical protein
VLHEAEVRSVYRGVDQSRVDERVEGVGAAPAVAGDGARQIERGQTTAIDDRGAEHPLPGCGAQHLARTLLTRHGEQPDVVLRCLTARYQCSTSRAEGSDVELHTVITRARNVWVVSTGRASVHTRIAWSARATCSSACGAGGWPC